MPRPTCVTWAKGCADEKVHPSFSANHSKPRASQWLLAMQPSVADCLRWKAMWWLNSQGLVFGSREKREHGPSHSLGKRCTPSWTALALPSFAEKAQVSTHTHTQGCVCSLWKGHPGCRTRSYRLLSVSACAERHTGVPHMHAPHALPQEPLYPT